MVNDYHITDAVFKLVVNAKAKEYRMLITNASKSTCLSIKCMMDAIPLESAPLLIAQAVSSEALQQFSRFDQGYIPCDGLVCVAESNLDVTNVYQQRRRSALTCADGHGTLATRQVLRPMLTDV